VIFIYSEPEKNMVTVLCIVFRFGNYSVYFLRETFVIKGMYVYIWMFVKVVTFSKISVI
jgi:hypothetical protein